MARSAHPDQGHPGCPFGSCGSQGCATILALLLYTGCRPSPDVNVLGYLLTEALDTTPSTGSADPMATGLLTGRVLANGRPLEDAVVVVAENTGQPHSAATDAAGRYRLTNLPPGQYVTAVVAPGYEETAAGLWGIPRLETVAADQETVAPDLYPHRTGRDATAAKPGQRGETRTDRRIYGNSRVSARSSRPRPPLSI